MIRVTKICSSCKIEKNRSEFVRDKKRKDGLYPQCKECGRLYYEKNKDRWKNKKKELFSKLEVDLDLKRKKFAEQFFVVMADGTELLIKNINVGNKVIGYSANGISKIVPVLYKSLKPRSKAIIVKLKSGRNIVVGLEEDQFIDINGTKSAKDVTTGDYIGIPKILDFKIKKTSDPQDIQKARFLGYIAAEGAFYRGACNFSSGDDEILSDFEKVSKELGFETINKRYKNRNCSKVSLKSCEKSPRNFIVEHGLNTLAKNKYVPLLIKKSNNEVVKNFISTFFAGDGWVNKHSKQAGATLASPQLTCDLQALLLRFGIHSSVHFYENKCAGASVLSISSKQELINSIPDKQGKADLIPTGWEKLLLRRPRARIFRNQGVHHSLGEATAREKVKRFAAIDKNKKLKEICESDIRWDKIISISHPFEKKSYYIEVGGDRKYIRNHIIIATYK
jgi:hypothetical protein